MYSRDEKMIGLHESAFDRELNRRLNIIESADYVDPAREDLPLIDIVVLCLGVAFVIAISTVVFY
jgi:hypothetical protein